MNAVLERDSGDEDGGLNDDESQLLPLLVLLVNMVSSFSISKSTSSGMKDDMVNLEKETTLMLWMFIYILFNIINERLYMKTLNLIYA